MRLAGAVFAAGMVLAAAPVPVEGQAEIAGGAPTVRLEIDAPEVVTGRAATAAPVSLLERLRSLVPAAIGPQLPGETSVLPYFEIDTRTQAGKAFLWALRNHNGFAVDVEVVYLDPLLGEYGTDSFALGPEQVRTRNLRDVPGILPDSDGRARGLVFFIATSPAPELGEVALGGDFFEVEPGENFASGSLLSRLGSSGDLALCRTWETRYLQGGPFTGGTRLTFLVDVPGGPDCDLDPPTVTGQVYDEVGTLLGAFEICSAVHTFAVPMAQLLPPGASPFGAVEVEFPSTVGLLATQFRARGRFSVGMQGLCLD